MKTVAGQMRACRGPNVYRPKQTPYERSRNTNYSMMHAIPSRIFSRTSWIKHPTSGIKISVHNWSTKVEHLLIRVNNGSSAAELICNTSTFQFSICFFCLQASMTVNTIQWSGCRLCKRSSVTGTCGKPPGSHPRDRPGLRPPASKTRSSVPAPEAHADARRPCAQPRT